MTRGRPRKQQIEPERQMQTRRIPAIFDGLGRIKEERYPCGGYLHVSYVIECPPYQVGATVQQITIQVDATRDE